MTAPAWRGVPTVLALAFLLAQGTPSCAEEGKALSALAGDPASPLRLDTLEGGKRGLGEGRERITLVHFFATWCEPCRPELASLDALRTDRDAAGLDILAISVAEPEMRLRRYFADNPTGLTILIDRDRAASRAWGIEALPSTIVVDRAGRARLAVRGDLDWGRPDVRAALDAVLVEPATDSTTRTGGNPR